MLERIGDQVLDDAFELRRIDVGDDRLRGDLERASVVRLCARDARDQLADVCPLGVRSDACVPEAIDVEQVREQPLEP